MPCNCKKKSSPVTVMSGGYESPTQYEIDRSTDALEQNKIVTTTSEIPFIVKRGETRQTFMPNKFFGLKVSEIEQLLELGAPIYVYG